MSLPPWLLDVLACPACRCAVALAADGARLTCSACGRNYPIKDGIPVMLVAEGGAEPEKP